MRVLRGEIGSWGEVPSPSAVTIGVLDGVHLGHQALIGRLGSGFEPTVVTFDPHPVEVLKPGTDPRLITDIDERIDKLAIHGVTRVAVLDLAEIREFSPDRFVKEVLVDKLNVGRLVVGNDFRFGRGRSGDVNGLVTMAADNGFEFETLDLVGDTAGVLSSSRIRTLIETGKVDEAATLLGSTYSLANTVIQGDQRGRQIGFPTANLRAPERKVIPARGIYAAFVEVRGEVRQAAVNVGVRPTFGGGELLVEPYILDFNEEIYGEEIRVEFVAYIRPEAKFDGVEDLVTAMTRDVDEARRILAAA